jgi:hypothetical protein
MCISVSKDARETQKKLSRFSKRSLSYAEERQKKASETETQRQKLQTSTECAGASISKYPHLESGNDVAVHSEKGELIIPLLPGI